MCHPRSFALRVGMIALVLMLTSATVAQAAPSAIATPSDSAANAFRSGLTMRQAQLERLRAQIADLDQQAEVAAEAYDLAQQTLTDTQSKLAASRAELSAAQSALDTQTALLDTRVDSLYRDNGTTNVEVLLSARSIADFITRAQAIISIAQADADLAQELSAQRDQIQNRELDLEKADLLAQSLEFTLRARKTEIQLQIQDREAVLAAAQSDLVAALESEAKQRSAQELTLWRQIIAGAADIGVTIERGSPAETILAYHGIPYVWGGSSPSGFDCSGLTMYVMAQHGVTLPHHAASQFMMGAKVAPGDLRPGDLVFFGSPVHHVGMYIGGGYFVEAPNTGDYVKVSELADRSDFAGARRYAWRYRVVPPAGLTGAAK